MLLCCGDCPTTNPMLFNSKSDMKRHTNEVHTGIVFRCDECPMLFKLQTDQRLHKTNVHERLIYGCEKL